jgi:hypothetical protein
MRGSVTKRGKTWTYILPLGRDPATGRQRQKWVGGFATKRAAEEALTAALERVRLGTYVDPGATTVAQFLDRWLAAVGPTVRRSTLASYTDVMTGHVVTRIGNTRLAKLAPMALSELYAELLVSGRRVGTGGLSPRTVQYVHRILTHAFGDAVR